MTDEPEILKGPVRDLCSPVMQMAYLRDDIEVAMKYWIEVMGVGPFFYVEDPGLQNVMFQGQPATPRMSIALAYWGDVQIELIQSRGGSPSIYSDSPYAIKGLHHSCVKTESMDDVIAAIKQVGGHVVMSGDYGETGRVIYADLGGGEDLLEVVQLPAEAYAFFDMAHQAAQTWDGSDPIRRF